MDIIQKKDIDFNSLLVYDSPANSESILFYDDDYMYKMFKEKDDIHLLRKKLKLELLSLGGSIDSAILPESMIMDDKRLSGYKMQLINTATPIFDFCSKSRNVNDFLRLMYGVSLSLRNIHNDPRKIVVGDLSISNIIFDENMKHYFIDFDSVMIGKIPADRVPYSLERYARKCGISKYDVSKDTDKFCLFLSFFFVIFRKSIEEVSMREYDAVSEKVESLRNMREIVLEIKKYKYLLLNLPYLDEIISSNIFINKRKIRAVIKGK